MRSGPEAGVAFMLDQCHNIEPKIPGQIRSVMNVQEATAKALLVDQPALEAAQASGDVLGANAVLMDAYDTDVRPLLRRLRERMGLDPEPMAAYARSGYAERIVADRVGGQAGGVGRMTVRTRRTRTPVAELLERAHRLGADPTRHELRRRECVGQGHGHRPGDRRPGRAALGEGVRRRPRDPDRGRPVRAPARPAARPAGRVSPGSSARTRWSPRSTTACMAEVAQHPPSTPRCTACRGGPRRPPPSRRGHRVRDRRRRGDPHRGVLRGPGRLGAVAPAGVPAGPRHRRDRARPPRCHRGRPRRPRDHGLGRDLRCLRGQLVRDHPRCRAVHRRARPGRAVRQDAPAVQGAALRGSAGTGGRPPAGHPRPGVDRPAAGSPFHRQRGRP